jgi:hypothetical protein
LSASTEVGVAMLQAGAVLTVSVVVREYCARHLTVELVPNVLRSRIRLCNRMAPMMLFLAVAMVLTGGLVCFTSS